MREKTNSSAFSAGHQTLLKKDKPSLKKEFIAHSPLRNNLSSLAQSSNMDSNSQNKNPFDKLYKIEEKVKVEVPVSDGLDELLASQISEDVLVQNINIYTENNPHLIIQNLTCQNQNCVYFYEIKADREEQQEVEYLNTFPAIFKLAQQLKKRFYIFTANDCLLFNFEGKNKPVQIFVKHKKSLQFYEQLSITLNNDDKVTSSKCAFSKFNSNNFSTGCDSYFSQHKNVMYIYNSILDYHISQNKQVQIFADFQFPNCKLQTVVHLETEKVQKSYNNHKIQKYLNMDKPQTPQCFLDVNFSELFLVKFQAAHFYSNIKETLRKIKEESSQCMWIEIKIKDPTIYAI